MKLLLDIGNTRLKWAIWDGVRLEPGDAVSNGDCSVDRLTGLWRSVPKPESAWVASVADPALDGQVTASLRAVFGLEPTFVHSVTAACGVRNAYRKPRNLGVDRFLGLIATHAGSRQPAVVAGCGTALTLDALAADGKHLGGLIAPSPALMQRALRGNAARLGDAGEVRVVEMAVDTADAIESGTRLAAVALIERFVGIAAGRFGAQPSLVLTGGGATSVGEHLASPHRLEPQLVLAGLARLADSGDWNPTQADALQ